MLDLTEDDRIAVIGLGYVGLPLAVEFGKRGPVRGFDIDASRIRELREGRDRTLEVEPAEMGAATRLEFTDEPAALADCRVFIVTVPTPIDRHKQPDLTPLIRASETVGRVMTRGAVIVYESTVYPGATEEIGVPILARESGLTYNEGFFCGYSPERVNPGDEAHRVSSIVKVTSGSTPAVGRAVDALYRRIVTAGTHLASSIRVAEAAKVIENIQRDLNIALVNELAIIFERLGIDTLEVLEAAGTKWNFLNFRPGLVGGHCIGVDPYYLAHKAREIGHHPQVILSGRRTNDGMGGFVAGQVVRMLTRRRVHVVGANVLLLGLAFKENCPDLRNTRVVDILTELESYHANVEVHDPWVNAAEARAEYGIEIVETPRHGRYEAIILAVAHETFVSMGASGIRALGTAGHVLYDIKGALPRADVDARL